jgi:pimeloyl-ACP methyl ester carboxylesterase
VADSDGGRRAGRQSIAGALRCHESIATITCVIPETRYAKSGDVTVAYQVTGEENPIDLIWAPGIVSHLDLDWEFPEWASFLRSLSSFARLIRFDKRGTGLSDRGIHAATLEERTDDIRAVMDAAGSERAVIAGDSEGGCMACVFAATYPERTRGLALWGTQARWVQTDDYPWGWSPEEHVRVVRELGEQGMTVDYLTGAGCGIPNDPAIIEFMLRFCRSAASPTQLAALERMCFDMDIRDILPSIRVPTLVMARANDPVIAVAAAQQLADAIPSARLLEFPGDGHRPIGPDQAAIVAALEEFVTGERSVVNADRVLATVLFTDIVDSTRKAAELGDARWRALLDAHDGRAKSEIARHRGTYVQSTGDGLFATFDGPARAVRCARAIAESLRPLGIEIRAGCHTGEIEYPHDGEARGIAVHIGARIAARAGADEVLVSATVKDLVAGSGLLFDDRGACTLKGVPDEWRLFSVRTE